MRIILIRHGESEADLLQVHEGRADFPLTAKGHKQAQLLSRWIKEHYQVDYLYCSPLQRACQTAQHLSEAIDVPPIIEERLMEFNNGLIAGLDRTIAQKRYPFVENLPVHQAVYEQESKLEFRCRAEYLLSKIIADHSENATIAMISHGGMINQLFRAFIQAPLASELYFMTGDTGIHEWRIEKDRRYIMRSNWSEHLCDSNTSVVF